MSLFALAESARADLTYTVQSSPAGIFGSISGSAAEGATVTSPVPPMTSGSLQFAYWSVNGVPDVAALFPSGAGPARTRVRVSLTQTGTAFIAYYLPAAEDADNDGIPDWREWREFGSLALDGSSEPDSDGLAVAAELERGYPPQIADRLSQGGVFRTASASLGYHDPARRFAYHYSSEPAGLLLGGGFVEPGNQVTSPNLDAAIQGYRLGYWTVDGSRVVAGNGGSRTRIVFPVNHEDTEVMAYYFPENGDSDNDTLLDWDEYRLYGTLAHSVGSDADADGMTHAWERNRAYAPSIADRLVEGGVFRTSSASVVFRRPGAVNAYTIASEPAGFHSGSGQGDTGSSVTLPNLPATNQGYRFCAWLVDGVSIAGADGSSKLTNASFTLTHDDMRVVAKYVQESTDSDLDLLLDWVEWSKFGGLQEDESTDADGDGFIHADETKRGYSMTVSDRLIEGGTFRTSSASVAYHDPARKYRYTLASEPAGLQWQSASVDPGTVFTTPNLTGEVQGYTFTHWSIDGVRQTGPDGAARTQAITSIDHDEVRIVAHYVPTSADTDTDGIADWFEWRYFDNLFHSNTTSADGDGFLNGVERARGYAVTIADQMVEGGVFRTSSASVAYHDPAQLVVYEMKSDPAGLIAESKMVAAGTVFKTPNLTGEAQGYSFGYWTVDGVRQSAGSGYARTQISVPLVSDYMQIVAHYLTTAQDGDGDSLPDWWEQRFLGKLDQAPADDSDADTWSIQSERTRGYSAISKDTMIEGGVFRTSSKSITYHDPATYKSYLFASDPLGLLMQSELVLPGTVVVTPNLFGETQSYTFAFWSLDGERLEGAAGVALTRFSFEIIEDTEIIGHYLLTGQDSDTDTLADWWEWFYLGSLVYDTTSTLTDDGFTVGQSKTRGYNSTIPDRMAEGGVFRTSSRSIRWHNPATFVSYTMRSEPEGLLTTDNGLVAPGATVLTPVGHGTTQGYTFAYWSVNGIRQTGQTGRALERVSVNITATSEIVAHYLPTGSDSDADGIVDTYEWTELGGLALDKSGNPDTDGFTVGREIDRGYSPVIRDVMEEGGVFRTSSATLTVQLKPYNNYHTLAVTVSPAGAGQVHGAGSYKQGTNALLTPNPTPGLRYVFTHWSGDLTGEDDPGTVPVYSSKSVTAHFLELGAFEYWKHTKFGPNAPDLTAGDLADPDHDGVPNLVECALNGDPLVSGGNGPQPEVKPAGLSIRFQRDSSISELTLEVESSDSMSAGTWTSIARSQNGQAFVALAADVVATEIGEDAVKDVTVTSPTMPNSRARFLRVRVSK